ncbi:metal ABC transporter ATP-binding protein, partial [Vibrio sp. Vb0932]|nr:metal ABC transporter ATP-binding protein [Vibrio sp. Vb0932]
MLGPSISIDNLSLQYGDNVILQNVTTTFEPGKCHVIMGPNGGGKTS